MNIIVSDPENTTMRVISDNGAVVIIVIEDDDELFRMKFDLALARKIQRALRDAVNKIDEERVLDYF